MVGWLAMIWRMETAVEQLVTAVSGAEVGRIIYDSFGGVVTSTMPAELNSAFTGLPDAASGLVHVGGGRWYDPALGRPLQPNPAGGAPTAPQTISRYAATPMGQPGVAQAAAGSGFNAIPSVISFVYGTSTALATHALEPSLVEHAFTGYSTVRIIASRNTFKTRLPQVAQSINANFTTPIFFEKVGNRQYYESLGIIPLAAKSHDDLYKSFDDIIGRLANALPSRGTYAARISGNVDNVVHLRYGASLQKWTGAVTGVGAGIDFVVGFGFQISNDLNNPYISPNKAFSRAIISGSGGALFSFLGGGLGSALCGPPCTVLGSVVGGLIWSEVVQPVIYNSPILPFRPDDRNLLRLGGTS